MRWPWTTPPPDPLSQLLAVHLANRLQQEMDARGAEIRDVVADTGLRAALIQRALLPDRDGLPVHVANRLAAWCGLRLDLVDLDTTISPGRNR